MSIYTITNGALTVEDAHLRYKNFSGVGGDYNSEGKRNFNLVIDDPEFAQQLNEEGWHVRFKEPRDPQDVGMYLLKVNVNYEARKQPEIWMHDELGRMTPRLLSEEDVGQLDTADIVSCDIQIRPWKWVRGNDSGISAYLEYMHVFYKEDPFKYKYANLESNSNLSQEDIIRKLEG